MLTATGDSLNNSMITLRSSKLTRPPVTVFVPSTSFTLSMWELPTRAMIFHTCFLAKLFPQRWEPCELWPNLSGLGAVHCGACVGAAPYQFGKAHFLPAYAFPTQSDITRIRMFYVVTARHSPFCESNASPLLHMLSASPMSQAKADVAPTASKIMALAIILRMIYSFKLPLLLRSRDTPRSQSWR